MKQSDLLTFYRQDPKSMWGLYQDCRVYQDELPYIHKVDLFILKRSVRMTLKLLARRRD